MKYIALLLVSAFFFLLTYFSTPGEFSNKDLLFIAIISCTVIFLQSIVLNLFSSKIIVQNFLFSIFAFSNIYCLHLILIPSFYNMDWIHLLGIALLGIFILYTIAKIIRETKYGGLAFCCCGLAACTAVVAGSISQSPILSGDKSINFQSALDMAKSKHLEFTKKPNVYFISFDSLIPKVLLSKHMGVDNSVYHEVLEKDFRKLKNVFADAVSTKRSLNALLALEPNYFRELEGLDDGSHLGMYTGSFPSPLFQIFANNGYKTNTLFNSRYFGPKKGEFVNNYWINRDVSVCDFFDRETAAISFFGYCKLNNPNALNRPNTFNSFLSKFAEDTKPDPVSFLLSSMKNGIESEKPQVFVAYVYSPGHTKMTFQTGNEADLNEYKKKYLKGSEAAAKQIKQIVSFLKKNDPEGILVLFGDHGPWLSRSVSLKENPEFFIQDRYGVYGGIYPKTACENYFQYNSYEDFTTISKIAIKVLGCLSNSQSNEMLQEPFYPIFNEKTKVRYKYENYLYE